MTATTALAGRLSAAWRLASGRVPGVMASTIVAIAAVFLSQTYNAPVMLMALLLGMAFHFLSQEGPCVAGIDLVSTHVLRIAVGLLGAQISLAEIVHLGAMPILTVVAAVLSTIAAGVVASRAIGLGTHFGLLTGGAVSICGASAALAVASVLPRSATSERDTAFTVVCVTALSTAAMIVYPIVALAFGLDPPAIGVFLGGTIHDVAQVVGAGYSVSDEVGIVATFTKLMRVALLLPIVLALTLVYRAGKAANTRSGASIPGFLLAFGGLMLANSLGLIPSAVLALIKDASRWGLIAAIAALGMKTSLKSVAEVGGKALGLLVGETLFLAVLVLTIVTIAR